MISDTAITGFDVRTFLSGPEVISDSSKAKEFVLRQLRPTQFGQKYIDEFWDALFEKTHDCSLILEKALEADPHLLKTKICVKEARSFFINPLIAAIFTGNFPHIQLLLTRTKNINKADAEGYTPCHYAAMVSNFQVLQLFQNMGADFEKRNIAGSSPADFVKHRFSHLPGVRDFYLYLDHTGPGYNQHFYQLKVKQKNAYLTQLVYLPETLLAMRVFGSGGKEENRTVEFGDYLYEQFMKKESIIEEVPPIYMQSLVAKDDGTEIPSFLQGQYEVRARRDIKPGELLTEYTGFCISDHFYVPTSFKRMGMDGSTWERMAIDADKAGNIAAYINDGPPNCMAIKIMHNGLPHYVIASVHGIKKDETIRLCYGKNFFKNIEHVELSPRAIESYLEETKGLREIAGLYYLFSSNQVVDITTDEKTAICNTRSIDSTSERIEWQISFRYHIAMISYLISYENHLQEYIKSGLINSRVLQNTLYALDQFDAIERLGLNRETYTDLYNKIADWGKSSSQA